MPDITDDFDHGPYPREWDDATRELWDSEPNTFRELYDAGEWRDLQTAFNNGWVTDQRDYPKEYYDEWRNEFFEISGISPESFDWAAWRAYLGY